MSLEDTVLVFALSLLVGTVAILAGVRLVLDTDAGVPNAALTALIGALAWALASYFVGWIPILGVLSMLVIWIGVVNWRYPGGWGTAVAIGFVAWLVAVGIVYAFAMVDLVAPEVLGVPGV